MANNNSYKRTQFLSFVLVAWTKKHHREIYDKAVAVAEKKFPRKSTTTGPMMEATAEAEKL